MKVVIYDDYNSVVHTILGALTMLLGVWVYILFSLYELTEFMMKHNEKVEHFIGDMIEYCIGVSIVSIVMRMAYDYIR